MPLPEEEVFGRPLCASFSDICPTCSFIDILQRLFDLRAREFVALVVLLSLEILGVNFHSCGYCN